MLYLACIDALWNFEALKIFLRTALCECKSNSQCNPNCFSKLKLNRGLQNKSAQKWNGKWEILFMVFMKQSILFTSTYLHRGVPYLFQWLMPRYMYVYVCPPLFFSLDWVETPTARWIYFPTNSTEGNGFRWKESRPITGRFFQKPIRSLVPRIIYLFNQIGLF